MGELLLFGLVFIGGTCIILADSGEKKAMRADITEHPPTTVNNYITESFDYGDDYNDTDDDDEARSRNIKTHILKKDILDSLKSFKLFNKVTRKPINAIEVVEKAKEEMYKKKEEEHRKMKKMKLVFKLIAGVAILLTCSGLTACTRRLCKKNRRTGTSNPEETVPALSTEPNTTIPAPYPLPYPQQPGVYPLQQIPNPYAASFQQNSPAYPMNPTSYSPALNVPEKGTNRSTEPETIPPLPTASNPGQPFLYPPQPGVYPLQQVSNPSAASFQQNALSYPTEPTSCSPSQNVPEKETNRL